MKLWDRLFGNNEYQFTRTSKETLHEDAQRYAQLLITDIKNNNEEKVYEGNQNADIYKRLKNEIERSRKVYDKRVSSKVKAEADYFHEELVKILAGGDERRLGTETESQK